MHAHRHALQGRAHPLLRRHPSRGAVAAPTPTLAASAASAAANAATSAARRLHAQLGLLPHWRRLRRERQPDCAPRLRRRRPTGRAVRGGRRRLPAVPSREQLFLRWPASVCCAEWRVRSMPKRAAAAAAELHATTLATACKQRLLPGAHRRQHHRGPWARVEVQPLHPAPQCAPRPQRAPTTVCTHHPLHPPHTPSTTHSLEERTAPDRSSSRPSSMALRWPTSVVGCWASHRPPYARPRSDQFER